MESTRRRSASGRHRRPAGGVKVVPYVVPTTRHPPGRRAVMVPTRWVKAIIGIFLLPVCLVLTQTFFTSFARATIAQRLWAAQEFWFFSLGAILWLIAFFGLPRPVIFYVFGHELTHVLWVWLMGGRVSAFRVGRDGGHIVTNRTNFWIALAPYFFPIYSLLAIALYGTLSLLYNMQPYGPWLYAIVGTTWAFHLTFTVWMIPKNQTDLMQHGTFFSVVVIYLMNVLLLSVLLIISSPQITFASFGRDLLVNISNFSQWVVTLVDRFERGAQG